MKYSEIREAIFIDRPNRFIAHVDLEGSIETVHVKNTGRCREILIPGAKVILEKSNNENRKTKYSLIAVYKGNMIINIDSQVPNLVAYEGILDGKISEIRNISNQDSGIVASKDIKRNKSMPYLLRREVKYGGSRFDLYFENMGRKGFVEVKGVTLENDKIVKFPDAPTERGTKHVYELIDAVSNGYEAYILFIIQMKGVVHFEPNSAMDKAFSEALVKASENGVRILAYDCNVVDDGITVNSNVPVIL